MSLSFFFRNNKMEWIETLTYLKKHGKKRLDIIIKYLFIKKYFEMATPDTLNYKPYNKIIQDRNRKPYPERYVSLIRSFKERGYDEQYPIKMAYNGVMSGYSHRLACCLYFGINKIPVIYNNHYKNKIRKYSKKDMSSYNTLKLEKTLKKLIKRFKRNSQNSAIMK